MLGWRFGASIKDVFVIFGNFEMEMTKGKNYGLECGCLFPVSERSNVGFAAGADIVSTSGLDSHIKDEGGYSVWIGLKIVRN